MLTSYAVGLAGIAFVVAVWLAVQLAWRRAFPDPTGDPDPLAGRFGCHGCHRTACAKRCANPAPEAEEDPR